MCSNPTELQTTAPRLTSVKTRATDNMQRACFPAIRYLQLLLLFDSLLLGIGDEDEDRSRLVFILLLAFTCRLLSSWTLTEEEVTSQ